MELQPGTLLYNQYRIEKQIGAGGQGRVYKAFCEKFSCPVVIKQNIAGEDIAQRTAFEKEAKLLRRLHHSNLPRVTDIFDTEAGQFLVMDFIPGKDWYTLLWEQQEKGEPFPLRQVLKWTLTLLDVLRYLHEQTPPIIHRDIKPPNVRISESGKLFLLDFGLAKGLPTQVGTRFKKSQFGYSDSYSPLEQIGGRGTDHRSDLYALAATIHHLLAGFDNVPPGATARSLSISYGDPDPLPKLEELHPEVSEGLAQVIRQAMDLRIEKRIESATEFAFRIDRQLLLLRKERIGSKENVHTSSDTVPDFNSQETKFDPELARNNNQRNAEILFQRGFDAYEKRDFDSAFEAFNSALEFNPDYPEALAGRGGAFAQKGELEKALADCNRALSLNPQLPLAWKNRGLSYYDKGDYDRAFADCNEAIRLKPDYAHAFINRGLFYHNNGDHDRAIADFNEAIRFKPDFALAFNNRGCSYSNKGDHDRAIADFNEGIRLNPDFVLAFHNRGLAYHNKGDHDRAIADFNEAIQLKPDYAIAFNNRGNSYFDKGDYDHAIADYTQAIRLNPEDADAIHNRGLSYRIKGDYDNAIADFNETIRLKPDDSITYRNRGIAFEKKGNKERAIADYRKALEIDPKHKLAKDKLERLTKPSFFQKLFKA